MGRDRVGRMVDVVERKNRLAATRYAAAGAQVAVMVTGHNVQIERPCEVADLIREFVDQLS